MHVFWKDFQRNLQDSIQMPDITKRNLIVHFILGNTGHAGRKLTVNGKNYQVNWLDALDKTLKE